MAMTAWIFTAFLVATALPQGYGQLQWGMSVERLKATETVKKADPSTGFAFSEHMEIDPEVYVTEQKDGKRLEYYFFGGRLYKVFVVYERALATPQHYGTLAKSYREKYGKPAKHYQETYFGFQVQHTLWEDPSTLLDLRMGAGFVYEVWLGRELAEQKRQHREREKSV